MEKYRQHNFKVFGLGGCGNNAINRMIEAGLRGADFVAADSNVKELGRCKATIKIPLGSSITKGQGCGGRAEFGRRCVEESLPEILAALAGCDMVFLTAGLGGGLGSGGLAVVAKALRELKPAPLTVAMVTRPFSYQSHLLPLANRATEELYKYCHSVISVDNSKFESLDQDVSFLENMASGNDVLYRAVSSIINVVEIPGEINIDLADVTTVLRHPGPAIISFGEASGEKRSFEAINDALSNPLMGETSLEGAKAVICNITADSGILLREVMELNQRIKKSIGQKVKLFFGVVIDDSLAATSTIRVTILAAGVGSRNFAKESEPQAPAEPKPREIAPPKLIMEVEPLPRTKPNPGMATSVAPERMEPAADNEPSVLEPGPYAASARRVIRPQLGSARERFRAQNEASSGVSPVNNNPKFYAKPPYIRKPAS
ncbi:MAG: hypothetical protein LBR11_04920 [Deltaproteobacteria bacterium]|jgi:cell division protein FtsZ|nr:hypothetical protein [Deltaproteobacteria bacterium]